MRISDWSSGVCSSDLEEGFKAALTTVVNKYAKAKNQLKEKDPNLTGDDVREGITEIISVRLRDPQFEGQTTGKLGHTSIKTLVQRAPNDKLGQWIEDTPTDRRMAVSGQRGSVREEHGGS